MTSSNDSYSPGSSTCMQEVSAQQDESSVGLFRGAGCVFSPSPLLLSLSPPFLPPSFLPSVRVCPLSPSISILLASWLPRPVSFIPENLSFNNGHSKLTYLSRWSETQCLTTASAPPKVFNLKCWHISYACSWCSVKVRTNSNISTHTAQNYQAPFCYKN